MGFLVITSIFTTDGSRVRLAKDSIDSEDETFSTSRSALCQIQM